jgi:hypothetical protein
MSSSSPSDDASLSESALHEEFTAASSQLMQSSNDSYDEITIDEQAFCLLDMARISEEGTVTEIIVDDIAIGFHESSISTLCTFSDRDDHTLGEDIASVYEEIPADISDDSSKQGDDWDDFTLYLPAQRRLSLLTVGTCNHKCQSPISRRHANASRQSGNPASRPGRRASLNMGKTRSRSPIRTRQRRMSLNAVGNSTMYTPKHYRDRDRAVSHLRDVVGNQDLA